MADRKSDEYQNVKFYEKNSKALQDGFSKFKVGKDFYFCRYIDGDIAMLSQAYTSEAGRDNGVESVKKNEKIAKRFKFERRGSALHGFALKAGNGQEIAISPDYESSAAAERVSGRLSGETKRTAPVKKTPVRKSVVKSKGPKPKPRKILTGQSSAAFTGSDARVENYKPLSFYKTNGGKADGFHGFVKNGAYYFHYNEGGKVLLISESYTSKHGRDNGIASVKKNMKLTSAYEHHRHKNGKFYFDINAANKQEIVTSRWFGSKSDANTAARRLRGESMQPTKTKTAKAKSSKVKSSKTKTVAQSAKAKSGNVEQNYMPVAFYKNATKGKQNGFESFKGTDGEYYFTYFENRKLALISEGYPTAPIRDKGLASVQKNMKLEKRYVFGKGAGGKEGFILRAGNNKEIARSVGYGSAAAAAVGAAYIIGTRKRVKKTAVKSTPKLASGKVAVAKLGTKPSAAKPKVIHKQTVKVKAPAVKAAKKPKPIKTKVKSVTPLAAGAVAVTGLAANTAAAKASPVKEKAVPVKAPATKSTSTAKPGKKKSKTIAPLVAGTVAVAGLSARVASSKAKAVKQAAVPVKAPPMKPVSAAKPVVAAPAVAAAISSAAVAAVAAKPKPEIASPPPAAAAPTPAASAAAPKVPPVAAAAVAAPATTSTAGGGIWGWLKWLLLALLALLAMFFLFKACAGGGKLDKRQAPAATTNSSASAAMITCWNGAKARNDEACPTKITCWDDSFAVQLSDCPVQPPAKEFECWDGSLEVDEASCPVKPVSKTSAGTTISSAAAATSVADAADKMTAPSVSDRICGPSPQSLFNVTSSAPKSVSYLGSNPQFGNSLTLTADGFFRKLSSAYQAGGSDRAFLNELARSLGYGSFRNMDASMFSNDSLPYGTSGLLGFGTDHQLQFSALDVTDSTDLEAFKVRSANGTDVHFMKRCGNFMYVCQP